MSNTSSITLREAKEHNLKNINLSIPRNKITCFVGVSGSGKSTIAFDIIAREGQRQYFESLNAYARRYLQKSNRPDVEEIEGISPTVIISQDRVRNNPRSTVGTITEAYTYLRMLYSRVGMPSMDSSNFSFNHPSGACKICKGLGRSLEVDTKKILDFDLSLNEGAVLVSDWKVGGRMWSILRATGYYDMDKKVRDFSDEELQRLLYSEPVLWQDESEYGGNKWTYQGIVTRIMKRNSNPNRQSIENDQNYFSFITCPACNGGKLNKKVLSVLIHGKSIGEVACMNIIECLEFVRSIDHKNATVIKPRLIGQLENLIHVGVSYLSLHRSADTLSGGEAQRVKLARQLSSELVETIYVLDEPTAGLHQKDVATVIRNLKKLRDAGNTVLVVEHDESVMREADTIVEIGPGGGKRGGMVVFAGSVDELLASTTSLTASYLNAPHKSSIKTSVRCAHDFLEVTNACRNNLKNLQARIPLGALTCLSGPSGAGKSSFVDTIIEQHSANIVLIGQDQIGSNKRSSIATYVGAFNDIRNLFASETGMSQSLFSYNSKGACRACTGLGSMDIDMNFLGNVVIPCEACHGSRYQDKVIKFLYKGKNIAEVLSMTVEESILFFAIH
ncbi:MAG: excinuclease ABC subunit UvrA, partial [Candidatus Dojkabacteria bacterium]